MTFLTEAKNNGKTTGTQDRTGWMIVKSIFETSDLSIFKKMVSNRNVHEANVKNLMKSISEHGFIPDYHVIVNESFEVVDGQNRLAAAKRLGVPVTFTIAESELVPDINRHLNDTGRKWQNQDYLDSYVAEGRQEYLKLQNLMDDIKCKGSKASSVLSGLLILSGFGSHGGNNKSGVSVFRRGEFQMPDDSDSQFWNSLDAIVQMSLVGVDFAFNKFSCWAMSSLVVTEGYNPDLFIGKVRTYGKSMLQRGFSAGSQLSEFVSLYNYRLQAANRIEAPR